MIYIATCYLCDKQYHATIANTDLCLECISAIGGYTTTPCPWPTYGPEFTTCHCACIQPDPFWNPEFWIGLHGDQPHVHGCKGERRLLQGIDMVDYLHCADCGELI